MFFEPETGGVQGPWSDHLQVHTCGIPWAVLQDQISRVKRFVGHGQRTNQLCVCVKLLTFFVPLVINPDQTCFLTSTSGNQQVAVVAGFFKAPDLLPHREVVHGPDVGAGVSLGLGTFLGARHSKSTQTTNRVSGVLKPFDKSQIG